MGSEDRHKELKGSGAGPKRFAPDARETPLGARSLSCQGKIQGLGDSQRGNVVIICGKDWSAICSEPRKRKAHTLLIIHNLTLVVLAHLDVVGSRVPSITADSGVRGAFICDHLEEHRATRARASEDQTHFAWLQKAGVPKRGNDVNDTGPRPSIGRLDSLVNDRASWRSGCVLGG